MSPTFATESPGVTLAVGEARVDLSAALGATVWPYVGPDADVVRLDALSRPGVRVSPAVAGVHVARDDGFFGEARAEEGTVHEGGLELGEARVGYQHPDGWVGAWVGRSELPLAYDREVEPEGLGYATRPVLSNAVLPVHANGAGTSMAWPDHGSVDVGASWPALTSDAPVLWTRLHVTPWGALPDDADAASDAARAMIAVGAATQRSTSLGTLALASADLAVRWRSLGFDASGLVARRGATRTSLLVGFQVPLLPGHAPDLLLRTRIERVGALLPDEDSRYVADVRLAARTRDRRVTTYLECVLSREQGAAVAEGEDVVDLGRGIERANDACGAGLLLRM